MPSNVRFPCNKFNGASSNFDGMGTNARDNNTLLVYLWSAF
jgi:hypothetical protein